MQNIFQLMQHTNVKQYQNKSVIYKENDPCTKIYFIISGEVEISQIVEKENS